MRTVTIDRIRVRVRGRSSRPSKRRHSGVLINPPTIGRSLVIHKMGAEERLITSVIRRVLYSSDDRIVYVETDNSVYRLVFVDEIAAPRETYA
jgi:hypothetical protein